MDDNKLPTPASAAKHGLPANVPVVTAEAYAGATHVKIARPIKSYVTVVGLLGAAIVSLGLNEFLFADILIFAAWVMAESALLRTPTFKHKWWARVLGSVVLIGICSLFCFDAYKMKGEKSWSNLWAAPSNPAFHVVRGNHIQQEIPPGWDGRQGFNLLGVSDIYVLWPLGELLTLSVTNTSDKPQTITGISVYERPGRFAWVKLCYISVRGRDLVFFTDPNTATKFSTDNALEMSLLGKTLAPSQEVRGWIAIQCPKFGKCAGLNDMRITLSSSSGAKYSENLLASEVADNTLLRSSYLTMGKIDFSEAKVRVLKPCAP